MPQMKQNSGESSTNNEYSGGQSSAPEHKQVVPTETAPNQQQVDFAKYMGNAPIAEKLAKQAGVQLDAPNYLDYTKQRELINQGEAQKFADSHQGLSNPRAIYDILQQGKVLEEKYRNASEGTYTPLTMGRVAQQYMDTIPQDMAWARQNPFSKEMGYEWADDKKLGELGWGADDIASMRARTEFHPQEIEELYRQGAIRAPYREYLAEQERLRQEAEAAAARATYYQYYSEPSYSEPVESPTYGNSVGFDQLDSDSMSDYKAYPVGFDQFDKDSMSASKIYHKPKNVSLLDWLNIKRST